MKAHVALACLLSLVTLSCTTPKKPEVALEAPVKHVLAVDPNVELYQTTPIETDLADPALRTAEEVWIERIDQAEKSIETAQFYIAHRSGTASENVISALRRAGTRGVAIRFLVSNDLLDDDPEGLKLVQSIPNLTLQVLDLSKIAGAGGILHAKYWIFDQETVCVGSQNFDWRALAHIHELGLRLRDRTLASALHQIFEIDWAIAGSREVPADLLNAKVIPFSKDRTIEAFASPKSLNPRGLRSGIDGIRGLIREAKHTIQFQILNYSRKDSYEKGQEWYELHNELQRAAERGVKIQGMVSHWNTREPSLTHVKALAKIPGVEIRMVTIPPHSSGFIPFARVIHTKQMIVDGKAMWLGTSNWSNDYFYHSRNVELVIRRAELAEKGSAIFERLWSSRFAARLDPAQAYAPFDPSGRH